MNRPEAKNAINPGNALPPGGRVGPDRCRRRRPRRDPDRKRRDFCAGADLDKLVTRSLKGLPPEDDWEQRIRDDYQLIFRGLLRSTAP